MVSSDLARVTCDKKLGLEKLSQVIRETERMQRSVSQTAMMTEA